MAKYPTIITLNFLFCNYKANSQLDQWAQFLGLFQGNFQFLDAHGAEGGNIVGGEGEQVAPILLGSAGLEGAKVDQQWAPGGLRILYS